MIKVNTFLFLVQSHVHVTIIRQWLFHRRNVTLNHTVYYAQMMVERKPAETLKEKKQYFREQVKKINKKKTTISNFLAIYNEL